MAAFSGIYYVDTGGIPTGGSRNCRGDILVGGFAGYPVANPTDYEMHILWSDKTIIRKNEKDKNEGWLKNWNEGWIPQDYMRYPWLLDWKNDLFDIKQQYWMYYSNNCAD